MGTIYDVQAQLSQTTYSVTVYSLLGLCLGRGLFVVADLEGKSTISFGVGFKELPCYENGERFGTINGERNVGGNILTMKNSSTGQLLVRTYVIPRTRDNPESYIVLEIMGNQTFKAPFKRSKWGEVIYYDVNGDRAVEFFVGLLCGGFKITARSDIPSYAVAILPLVHMV